MLQVSNAAVHELVGVRRYARAKVRSFDESDGHAPQRRIPRSTRTEDTAADDQNIEDTTIQRCKVSARHFRFQKQERITSFSNASIAITLRVFVLLS